MSPRLAIAALLLVSCGGGAPKPVHTSTRPAPEPEPPGVVEPWTAGPEVLRARIETLDREIASREDALGLAPLVPGAEPPAPMTEPGAGTCTRSARPACQDVCSLSDSICSAADEICRIADQLAGDAWAAGRCTAGKTSCARARERCCSC